MTTIGHHLTSQCRTQTALGTNETWKAISSWDTKERAKSSTAPTCSFNVNSENTTIIAMANLIALIQLFAANKKYQPNKKKKFILVQQVKDCIFLISKMDDRSWKHQCNQDVNWFWFQCI
jgi:hypothetical protein